MDEPKSGHINKIHNDHVYYFGICTHIVLIMQCGVDFILQVLLQKYLHINKGSSQIQHTCMPTIAALILTNLTTNYFLNYKNSLLHQKQKKVSLCHPQSTMLQDHAGILMPKGKIKP